MERVIELPSPDNLYHTITLLNIMSFKKNVTLPKNPLHKLVNSDGYYVNCVFRANYGNVYTYPVHIENLVLVKKQTLRKRIDMVFKKIFFFLP